METSHEAVVGVWREQAPRLLGGLLRLTRNLDLAEDLAHDAMEAALEQWPRTGVPDNPAAWLQTVAHRRAVDHLRRQERQARSEHLIANDLRTRAQEPATGVDVVEDDVLRLMLMSGHPALTPESQVALTLRLVSELTDDPSLRDSYLLPSVRGDSLERSGRDAEARVEFERAAALAPTRRQQAFFRRRAVAADRGEGDRRGPSQLS